MAAYLTNLARAYREKQYEIKTNEIQSFVGSLGNPTGMVTLIDGGRNIAALDVEIIVPLIAAAAENHIANSVDSDWVQRLEILYPDGSPYMYFLNYGVAATDATKPLNRYAILWYNDANAVGSNAALPDFGGAGNGTSTYRVLIPCGIPAGKGFRIRIFFNAVTVGYAADVTGGAVTINVTPLTTDAPIDTYEIQCQSLANVVGVNGYNDKLPSGKTLAGMLIQLVTTTEADVTRMFLKKSGAVYIDNAFALYGRQMDAMTIPARLTGELLLFFDAIEWDLSGVFNITVNANAGTFRIVTFHPTGSARPTPGAQASSAGKQAPAATSGASAPVAPAPTSAQGAQAAAFAVPPSFQSARNQLVRR